MATSTKKKKSTAKKPAPKPEIKETKKPEAVMEVDVAKVLPETVIEEAEEIVPTDDFQEGIMAEMDPRSRVADRLINEKTPAIDVVKESLDRQVTNLGRRTAEQFKKYPKRKVVIPKDPLNPKDEYGVVVGVNGWTFNIPRGKPVELPDPVIDLLIGGGYNPTLVR